MINATPNGPTVNTLDAKLASAEQSVDQPTKMGKSFAVIKHPSVAVRRTMYLPCTSGMKLVAGPGDRTRAIQN